jgi:hypothetical protein
MKTPIYGGTTAYERFIWRYFSILSNRLQYFFTFIS